MRLLNTNTNSLEFEEFFDTQVPRYAILSHRWGSEEVTLQDVRKGRKQDGQGHAKIKRCCAFAQSRGFQWVWIDTCCIDKKSSAELSETINSMYRWYQSAGECYAHLADVNWNSQDVNTSMKSFRQSIWFTRGWALQELLAPSSVIFVDRSWNEFGTKKTLLSEISAVTGISPSHLHDWSTACIATKMSWLSRRVTSRVEDLAYCTLGLFDINMPLLYGEGTKAFMRLQLEIIKRSPDESIFAWTTVSDTSTGMLAPWPDCFAQSGDITLQAHLQKKRFPYVMTNQGLEFQAPYKGAAYQGGEYFKLTERKLSIALNCWRGSPEGNLSAVTITLARHGNVWRRIECDRLRLSPSVQDSISDGGLTKRETKTTALIYIPQPGV